MEKRYGFVISERNARPVSGATVLVYDYGTTDESALFTDPDGITPLGNPVTTDENGYYEYYAADGRYSETITGADDTIVITDILLGAHGDLVVDSVTADTINATTLTATTATVTTLVVDGNQVDGPTIGEHSVPCAAVSIKPAATAGCADIASLAMGSGKPDIIYLAFDPTTEEAGHFSIRMPTNWNEGTIKFDFEWSHESTTTNFGVVFGLSAVAFGDGDSLNAAFGTEVTVSDTGGSTDTEYISAKSAEITVAGTPQAGDHVYFKIARKASDGSDTLAVDARLSHVTLYVTTDTPVG